MTNSSGTSQGMLELLADRFRALAEPARLHLIFALRDGEMTVGELVAATGLGQANASRHLQILHTQGFVTRRKAGLSVNYALADPTVLALCDTMYGRIETHLDAQRQQLSG